MFGNIDLNNINLQEVTKQLEEVAKKTKQENEKQIFSSSSGGGMVKISINANNEVVELAINDSLLEDKESLEILLISAMNDVIKQADENKKTMAMNMLGSINPFGK